MTWNVPAHPRRVFERNPLVAVVVEIRFFPILKLAEKIPEIQELVRGTFPRFQDVTRDVVNIQPGSAVEVKKERLFTFGKAGHAVTISLSTSTLIVDSRQHERRDHFISDAKLGIDALTRVCGPVVPTRLGVRYINVVDKEQIAESLGRPTSWPALIADRFLAVPTGLATLDATLFTCEVGSPMPSGGAQVVRYGLVEDSDQRAKFRLDIDRYLDNPGTVDDCIELLAPFADDVLAVFVASMGPDLRAWMPERSS